MRLQPGGDRRPPLLRPARAAQNGQRLLRPGQHRLHPHNRRRIGIRHRHIGPANIRHRHQLGLHLLGQRNHHRTGPARNRHIHRMRNQLRNALGIVDLRHPFRQRPEHPAIIHLLEALAVRLGKRDLADEQQHRRRVLKRHMHANGAMARPRPARHKRRRRPPGQLAIGLGHIHRPSLKPARYQLGLLGHPVQPVEHIQIALARHGKHMVDPLRHQGIGQNPATGARRQAGGLRCGHKRDSVNVPQS